MINSAKRCDHTLLPPPFDRHLKPALKMVNSILDIALGYFSTLAYATDFQLSVPFAKDLCKLARIAVEEYDRTGPIDSQAENTALDQSFNHQTIEPLPSERAYAFPSEVCAPS